MWLQARSVTHTLPDADMQITSAPVRVPQNPENLPLVRKLPSVAAMTLPKPRLPGFQRTPRYPRLLSGSLLGLVGMGLAASCGGAPGDFNRDAGVTTATGGASHSSSGSGGAPQSAPDAGAQNHDADASTDAGVP